MKHELAVVVAAVAVVASCGSGESPIPPAGSAAAGSAASGSAASAGSAVASAGSAGSATGSAGSGAVALSPKIRAARCGEPCLFLLDTPIAQLTGAFEASCAGMATKDLGFVDCKQLDYARNCIYAAHGLVYKKQQWKKVFEAKPWYEPDTKVNAKKIAMTDVEHANVHELYERGKACHKNMTISGADYERIRKWFAALPRPPMPKQGVHWENYGDEPDQLHAVDGKSFVDWMLQFDPKVKAQVAAGKTMWASYEDAATLAAQKQILDALKLTDPSKLRSIALDIEIAHGTEDAPFDEELDLRFLYDDKDQLVAITGEYVSHD